MKKTIIVISITAFLVCLPIASADNFIRDNKNRAVILHGMNISNAAKRTSDSLSWHTYDDYERMSRGWGFNCIRLLIFWSAIEPEPGEYDETYLDKVEELLKVLIDIDDLVKKVIG